MGACCRVYLHTILFLVRIIRTVAGLVRIRGIQFEIVAKRMPNDLGLYDMSGNVWEWVWDSYVQQVLPKKGTDSVDSALEMQRGGSYLDEAGWLALTAIDYDRAEYYGPAVGFRLATEMAQRFPPRSKQKQNQTKRRRKIKRRPKRKNLDGLF